MGWVRNYCITPVCFRWFWLCPQVMVHQSVISSSIKFEQELRRRNYVTPKNYLDFISNYKSQIANSKKRTCAP